MCVFVRALARFAALFYACSTHVRRKSPARDNLEIRFGIMFVFCRWGGGGGEGSVAVDAVMVIAAGNGVVKEDIAGKLEVHRGYLPGQ